MGDAVTTYSGREFHVSSIQWKKLCFLRLVLHLSLRSLRSLNE